MTHFSFIQDSEFELNGHTYRIISVIDEDLQIQNMDTGKITTIELQTAYQNFMGGQLIPIVTRFNLGKKKSVSYSVDRLLADLSPEEIKSIKIKLSFIKYFINSQSYKTNAEVERQLKQYWVEEEMGVRPSASKAYRWISKYLSSGENPMSLCSKTNLRGNRTQNVDAEVLDICNHIINIHYLTKKRNTIKDTYNEIVAAIARENRLRVFSKRLKAPSCKKIYQLVHALNKFEVMKYRYGKPAADIAFRLVQGPVISDGLNARWEVDHTTMDVIAVDDDFGVLLKRPILTTITENSTKMIMAAYVSFETCSTTRVLLAIKQAILPKTAIINQYPDLNLDWICHGIPDLICHDQGLEFVGSGLESFLLAMLIHSQQAPIYRGDKKGGVERTAGLVNKRVTAMLPGKTFASIQEKGFGYNPKKYACVPLSIIKEYIYRDLDIYHKTKHDTLNMTPRQKWKLEAKKRPIRLPADLDFLDAHIGQYATRTLSQCGIEFKNMYYTSKELKRYFQQHGSHQVELRYNPGDLSHITVMVKNGGTSKFQSIPLGQITPMN